MLGASGAAKGFGILNGVLYLVKSKGGKTVFNNFYNFKISSGFWFREMRRQETRPCEEFTVVRKQDIYMMNISETVSHLLCILLYTKRSNELTPFFYFIKWSDRFKNLNWNTFVVDKRDVAVNRLGLWWCAPNVLLMGDGRIWFSGRLLLVENIS